MSKRQKKSMAMATRGVTFRDFLIFQLKLVLDGAKDVAVFWISIGAISLDFIAGQGKRPRLFYSVMRMSERWDLWLNMHSVLERLETEQADDGLFGSSDAGDDTLIGQIERLVRRGDTPRKPRVKPPIDPL